MGGCRLQTGRSALCRCDLQQPPWGHLSQVTDGKRYADPRPAQGLVVATSSREETAHICLALGCRGSPAVQANKVAPAGGLGILFLHRAQQALGPSWAQGPWNTHRGLHRVHPGLWTKHVVWGVGVGPFGGQAEVCPPGRYILSLHCCPRKLGMAPAAPQGRVLGGQAGRREGKEAALPR